MKVWRRHTILMQIKSPACNAYATADFTGCDDLPHSSSIQARR